MSYAIIKNELILSQGTLQECWETLATRFKHAKIGELYNKGYRIVHIGDLS